MLIEKQAFIWESMIVVQFSEGVDGGTEDPDRGAVIQLGMVSVWMFERPGKRSSPLTFNKSLFRREIPVWDIERLGLGTEQTTEEGKSNQNIITVKSSKLETISKHVFLCYAISLGATPGSCFCPWLPINLRILLIHQPVVDSPLLGNL